MRMNNRYKLCRFMSMLIVLMLIISGCTGGFKEETDAVSDDASGMTSATHLEGGEYMQISVDEAVKMMEANEDYVILDVRTKEEFAEGHIPGAICIPNETIGEEIIDELPDKEVIILVYCRSGNRSKQAAAKLAAQGYKNIYEFGGIIDWKGEIVKD